MHAVHLVGFKQGVTEFFLHLGDMCQIIIVFVKLLNYPNVLKLP